MALTGLQIQKLLPKTNCMECGQPTCMVFAARMAGRFGWRPDPSNVVLLTDVVQGVYISLDRFSAPSIGVLGS